MNETNGLFHITAYQFNPESLTIAREYRGLKKNELAFKLNLTPSAITQFEKGEVKPTSQTIVDLCSILRFPASFFTKNVELPLITHEQCHFRSLMSCSQIERRRMVAAGNLIGKIVKFVDERVELPSEKVSGSICYGTETASEVEEAADKLRKDWGLGLGPIDNVIHLLEAKGILVFRLLEESRKLDAFSLWQGKRPFIFLNSEKGSASRSRFDASHELGHLILHSEYLPGNKFQELQANQFASAFLMPRETFLKECPHRLVWNHFLELKQRWKVSLAALVRRAKDLKIISEDTYKRANIQIKKNWNYDEPFEPEFETPTILPQAVELLNENNWSLYQIANEISISEKDLRWLIFIGSNTKTVNQKNDDENFYKIQVAEPKQNLINFPLDRVSQ